MSGNQVHVHGPHDHELEHASCSGDKYANRLATATAVLATFAVLFSYFGGLTMIEALIDKSDVAAKKTETANIWAYYQAKNTQQLILKTFSDSKKENINQYHSQIERYEVQKNELKEQGYTLQKEAKALDDKAEAKIHVHHRWSQAGTVMQIAIAIAAISLLTRKMFLNYVLCATSMLGFALAGMALCHL